MGALFPTDILLTVLVDAVCTVQAACRALSEAVSRILQLARLVPLASAALVAGCEKHVGVRWDPACHGHGAGEASLKEVLALAW